MSNRNSEQITKLGQLLKDHPNHPAVRGYQARLATEQAALNLNQAPRRTTA